MGDFQDVVFLNPVNDLIEAEAGFKINPAAHSLGGGEEELVDEEDPPDEEAADFTVKQADLTAFIECKPWKAVKETAFIQLGYEAFVLVLLLISTTTTFLPFDIANAIAPIFSVVSSLCIVTGLLGQAPVSVQLFSCFIGLALMAGLALHGYSFWWYYGFCTDPCHVGKDECFVATSETHVGSDGEVKQVLVYGSFGSLSVPPRACMVAGWKVVFIGLQSFTDLCVRCYGLGVGALEYANVLTWWEQKNRIESYAANRVQAIFRGNADRARVRQEGGIVTKALAGKEFAAKLYRPKTPLERRCQIVLREMASNVGGGFGQTRKLQTFHQIRSQTSENHAIFMEIKKIFVEYDGDKSGAIEVGEAKKVLKDMGAQISDEELEYLFIEAFAPPASPDAPFTISKTDQNARRTAKNKAPSAAVASPANEADTEGSPDEDEDDNDEAEPAGPVTVKIGDKVKLKKEVVTANLNNITKTGSLGPADVGVVVGLDPESDRLQCEVENTTKGASKVGEKTWFREADLEPESAGKTEGTGVSLRANGSDAASHTGCY